MKAADSYGTGLRYALARLADIPNIYRFLDYGHLGWPGGQNGEVALVNFWRALVEEDIPPFEGIAMNVGGYTPLDEPFMLDNLTDEKYTLPKGLQDLTSYLSYFDAYVEAEINTSFQVLIDTAKNGWGA